MTYLKYLVIAVIALGIVLSTGCTRKKAELGTEENPVKLLFVPSVDSKVIEENANILKTYLEKETPYKFKVEWPSNYVAVVEAFGTKRADIAAINTFGYILAHQKYGAEARLVVIRYERSTYQSQILVRTDSGINKVEDLKGKKIAFVDPASTSGYLLPMKTLKDAKVQVGESVFGMKHDNVVSMVYQKQVDAGATFYSPPSNGVIQDARRFVLTQYPDIEAKTKIISLSQEIPNDPIIFRKDMPEEIKVKVIQVFKKFIASPEGKASFDKIYGVTDFKDIKDSDYDKVRQMLTELGKSASELVK